MKKAAAQMKPGSPKRTKAQCQLTYERVKKTRGAVNAPAQRAAVHRIPCARTRSRCGSQTLNAFVRFGKPPASPAPKKNCTTHIDEKFHIQPMSAVNVDHHRTMRISTRRGPIQSPSQPPGISKSA